MALTNKDIEKLVEKFSGIFATKEDLKEEISKLDRRLSDKILTSHDEIMKKLSDLSTEKIVMMGQYRRHDSTIENHEVRIKTLEQKVLVP